MAGGGGEDAVVAGIVGICGGLGTEDRRISSAALGGLFWRLFPQWAQWFTQRVAVRERPYPLLPKMALPTRTSVLPSATASL
ncbi:hypothetical protein GCM10028824_01670 [Hymenobacter segetis]